MDINIDPKAARWEVSRLFSFEPVIVFLILISPTGLYARNRKMNSLRAGIGINVHEHYYGLSAGPSQFCKPKVHGFTFCIFEMARLDRNRCRFDI